jgi:hypothetical protein
MRNKLIKNKKFIFTLVLIVCLQVNSFAFIGAVISSVNNNASAVRDAAYQAFMKIKIVEQIRILNQNYIEAKNHLNFVKECSKHKGGIAGYVADEVEKHAKGLIKETESNFLGYMHSSKEKTGYINKALTTLDSHIIEKLDYSEKIREIGNKKAKRLENLAKSAQGTMSNDEKDKFNRESTLLQLEYLSLLSSQLAELFNLQLEEEEKNVISVSEEEKNREERQKLLDKQFKQKELNMQDAEARKKKISEILEQK